MSLSRGSELIFLKFCTLSIYLMHLLDLESSVPENLLVPVASHVQVTGAGINLNLKLRSDGIMEKIIPPIQFHHDSLVVVCVVVILHFFFTPSSLHHHHLVPPLPEYPYSSQSPPHSSQPPLKANAISSHPSV